MRCYVQGPQLIVSLSGSLGGGGHDERWPTVPFTHDPSSISSLYTLLTMDLDPSPIAK